MLNYSTQKNNFHFKAICHLQKKAVRSQLYEQDIRTKPAHNAQRR